MKSPDLLLTQFKSLESSVIKSLATDVRSGSTLFSSDEDSQDFAWFEYVESTVASQILANRTNLLNASQNTVDSRVSEAKINCHAANLVQDTGPCKKTPGLIMIVAFNVPRSKHDEVERWYLNEHIPLLMKSEFWLRARRYECTGYFGDTQYTSIAVHELTDQRALDSAERRVARSTPWRGEFSNEEWFKQAGRFYYKYSDNS